MSSVNQSELINYLKSFPREVMIPVYGHTDKFGADTFFQCIIAPLDYGEKNKKSIDTNGWPYEFSPGFIQFGTSIDDTEYYRFGNECGIEPFVIARKHNGYESYVEVVEEFRLLNNLYFDRKKNEYRDLDNDTIVVKIEGNDFVSVHIIYLKRYLGAKSAAMLVHVDSKHELTSADSLQETNQPLDFSNGIGDFTIYRGHSYSCSIVSFKAIILGLKKTECGYWPYDQLNRQYQEFILGYDENGKEILFSSNPDKLQNLFGKNPTAPCYFTCIFFKRDVLKKYYDEPRRYSVTDSRVKCGDSWSLSIDNQSDEYISAYLGDLGRDLPEQEQSYWRLYNIAIDGTLSTTKFKRDFATIFTSPESPIFKFQEVYRMVNEEFLNVFGWNLFKPLLKEDEYCLTGLRIPLNNSEPEFDSLVLSLAKVLIDSLNEEQIKTKIEKDISGSINRFECWLKISNIEDYQAHTAFLRKLQNLRSSGPAHRKGGNYTLCLDKLDISSDNFPEGFKVLVVRATAFLEFIMDNIQSLASQE